MGLSRSQKIHCLVFDDYADSADIGDEFVP